MFRSAAAVAGVCLCALTPALLRGQEPAPPVVRAITITGAKEVASKVIQDALRIHVGDPLRDTPERIGEDVTRQYRDEGYTFARVKSTFDAASGVLALDIDEGTIDRIEFQGLDEKLVRTFTDDFALRPGDVFNRRRARQALDVLLQQTRGAVTPGKATPRTFNEDAEPSRHRGTFDLIDRDGERVLLVGLRERAGRFKLVPDLGEREDWFSSVDGFVPSLGMGIAVFDHDQFNHTFVAGHLSYRIASQGVGYSLGFERPLFNRTKLYVGGELHDLTASDDQWQGSSLEASLAASGPRRSIRDYYERRGVQINAAVRVHPKVEALFAWRDERHEPLRVTTDFSLWNRDEEFPPNPPAQDGRLNAVVIGLSVDSRAFDSESLEATYRRHQLDTLFGERLETIDARRDPVRAWAIDWTTEMAGPFGGDFDFRRHIVSARTRMRLSEYQTFAARAMGGWSEGVLPPQRLFGAGGLGSVHGYEFKEQVGDSLALLNLEYELGWRRGLKAIGFFDVGRAESGSPSHIAGLSAPNLDAPWLKGVGFGVGVGDFRVDFGYRVDAVPSSLRVTVRLGRTF